MNLILIAAVGQNRELGKNNSLIWSIKEDLDFFKEKTLNHKMVMGRNTFISLGRPLKNRYHIVISRTFDYESPSVEALKSLDEFFEKYSGSDEEVFVIGGAQMYGELLPYCSQLYLTEIEQSFDADTYFPDFDKSNYDEEVLGEFKEPYVYKHKLYTKKRG